MNFLVFDMWDGQPEPSAEYIRFRALLAGYWGLYGPKTYTRADLVRLTGASRYRINKWLREHKDA